MTKSTYSIKVSKQYFNFASAHFMLFANGTREPLHGHNYRVLVTLKTEELKDDMVVDFLDIKPLVRQLCDSLDHKLLLPLLNAQLEHTTEGTNTLLHLTTTGERMSWPSCDLLFLPLENCSAERLAIYLTQELEKKLKNFAINPLQLAIEVEETPGQSASYEKDYQQ